jgi:hypothetical protein
MSDASEEETGNPSLHGPMLREPPRQGKLKAGAAPGASGRPRAASRR